MKSRSFITGLSAVLLGFLLFSNTFGQFGAPPEGKKLTKEEAAKVKQLRAKGLLDFELKLSDLMLAEKETDGKITKITLERFHEHPVYAYRKEGTIQATTTDPAHLACVQKCLSDSYVMRPYYHPYSGMGFGGAYVSGTLKIYTEKKTLTILLTPIGFQCGEKGPLRQSLFYSWTLAKVVDDMITEATEQKQHLSRRLFSALSGESVIDVNKQIYWETRDRAQLQGQVEALTKEVEELRKLLEEKEEGPDTETSVRPKWVSISGKVLIDGKPLTHGFIRFFPKGMRPSISEIGPDGKFELSALEKKDGVVPGKHKIAIVACERISPRKVKWHAPKKYASPKTSGLTISADGSADLLTIELSWGGGKPFVEVIEGDKEK